MRKNKKIKNYFAEMAQQGWGEWKEIPESRWHECPSPPIQGLQKFIYNNVYSVQFVLLATDWGLLTRLLIRRNDVSTKVSWADKQRIKNELVGEDAIALEVFPPADDLFDHANIYHLWIIPKTINLPILMNNKSKVYRQVAATHRDPL